MHEIREGKKELVTSLTNSLSFFALMRFPRAATRKGSHLILEKKSLQVYQPF